MRRLFRRSAPRKRVMLFGLDCASPHLVFDEFADDLPNFRALMARGTYGVLNSALPCITVPAWSSMFSSRDPGTLGIYGFRNRADHSYDALYVADSQAVQVPRVWDVLGAHDKQSLILNVPQTYPVKPLNGHLVSGFMTAGVGDQFAYPAIFKQEVLKQVPDYRFDVRNFRNVARDELLRGLIDLSNKQYALLEYALKHKEWDFAAHVNIGVDRVHHGFWRYHDPQHRLYEPDSPYKDAIRDYYKLVDDWLGRIVNQLDDNTTIMVVSDHGVKRMDGAIAINEWLWRTGWLTLKQEPTSVVKFSNDLVDWMQTRAWSTGGYYGRIFMNVQGREPQGTIPPADYERVRDELASQLRAIPDDVGTSMNTQVFKPQDVYQQVNNIAPDLLVYFGDLHWRTAGTIGYGKHYLLENDTGPDDANHAVEGMFLIARPHEKGAGRITNHQLMDIAPTILDEFGLPIPDEMQGRVIKTK